MLVPLIAFLVVLFIIVFFVAKNAKGKDQGNRPA